MSELTKLVIDIFEHLDLNDKKLIPKIKSRFNILDLPDHEWIEVEESIITLIKQLKKHHENHR